MKQYAQILKSDNTVNLIGGTDLGLPVENHNLVYCIDITDRADKDNIELYMVYNSETDTFSFPQVEEAETTVSLEDQIRADFLNELIEQDLLK